MKTKCRSTQARLKGQAHGLDHETEREAFERNQEEKTANRRGGRMVYRFVEENTAIPLEATSKGEIQPRGKKR